MPLTMLGPAVKAVWTSPLASAARVIGPFPMSRISTAKPSRANRPASWATQSGAQIADSAEWPIVRRVGVAGDAAPDWADALAGAASARDWAAGGGWPASRPQPTSARSSSKGQAPRHVDRHIRAPRQLVRHI